jgi:hypothetical protein
MGVQKRGEEAIAFSPLFILGVFILEGIHLGSPFWPGRPSAVKDFDKNLG